MGLGLRDERFDRAAEMPHRSPAGDDRLDARLESELGRLFFSGLIPQAEYEAGLRYSNIVLEYLWSIDAPAPFGSEASDLSEDACFVRKMNMSAANEVLRAVSKRSRAIVNRIAVYEQPLGENELSGLRAALGALAG